MRALVSGATGFIGRRLALALRERGAEVRCLVRNRGRAEDLERAGCELHEGDVLHLHSLRGAGRDVEVAYYLVHAMGRGQRGSFADTERTGAETFAMTMAAEGVRRIVYIGGLGD